MKKSSSSSLESNIFQLTIAYLSNNENAALDTDVIEFNDVEMSFEMFKNSFYHNNYEYFELNSQFTEVEELMIQNKTIRHFDSKIFKNGTRLNLVDIVNNKFISNKKMKINDIKRLAFIKDINRYNSLLDFKIYKNYLNFDDIFTLFNQQVNKDTKKYFRFKVIANYYSDDLDESVTMSFNYLVPIDNVVEEPKAIVEEPKAVEPKAIVEVPKAVVAENTIENIVYSNYINLVNASKLDSSNDEEEYFSDNDDDVFSDSVSESSFDNNNLEDFF